MKKKLFPKVLEINVVNGKLVLYAEHKKTCIEIEAYDKKKFMEGCSKYFEKPVLEAIEVKVDELMKVNPLLADRFTN